MWRKTWRPENETARCSFGGSSPAYMRRRKDTPWVSAPSPLGRTRRPEIKLRSNQCAHCKTGLLGREAGSTKLNHFSCPSLKVWEGHGAPQLVLNHEMLMSHEEPQVTLSTGGKPVEFLLDTRATFFVLDTQKGSLSNKNCNIKGVSGKGDTKVSGGFDLWNRIKDVKILFSIRTRMSHSSFRKRYFSQNRAHTKFSTGQITNPTP